MDKNFDILYPNILIKQIQAIIIVMIANVKLEAKYNLIQKKLYDFSTTKFIDEDKFSLSIKQNKAYEDHSYKRNEIIKNVFINITN